MFQAATEVFTHLSASVSSITDDELSFIEECVVIMYDRVSETNKVDEARQDLFARKQRQYNAVPPS
jgi:CO dehydrogenase/acetyl-CoA synthase beta subunit